MSRTYRLEEKWYAISGGQLFPWDSEEARKLLNSNTWELTIKYVPNGRDKKRGNKPPKWFKRINRKTERAKEKQAVRLEKEYIPLFKKIDKWEWN